MAKYFDSDSDNRFGHRENKKFHSLIGSDSGSDLDFQPSKNENSDSDFYLIQGHRSKKERKSFKHDLPSKIGKLIVPEWGESNVNFAKS